MVEINDATLREGNQTVGVKFSVQDSVEIARRLDEVGVDMIEIGHPLAGPEEFARVKAVADLGLNAQIVAHARAVADDILAVADTGAQWVGIFLGVNDITTKARVIGVSYSGLVQKVVDAVKVAKDLDLRIRYSCEDASRTEDNFLFDAFEAAIEAGADRICYADTIGYAAPSEVRKIVEKMVSRFPNTSTEVHLHDDRGLAMASTLEAIEAGITSISTSINNLGERCGITELCNLLVNLGFIGERPLPNLEQLRELSQLVARVSGVETDSVRPVVGKNAFLHGSKLHRRASSYEPRAYDWIREFVYQQEAGLVTSK